MSAERPKGFCVRKISCPGLSLIMVKTIKTGLLIDYSGIYNRVVCKANNLEPTITIKQGCAFAQKVISVWKKKNGSEVFREISNVLGLAWERQVVDVYVVQDTIPFGPPITIPMTRSMKDIRFILIHELIHQILIYHNIANSVRLKYMKKYEIPSKAADHILLCAVEKQVILNIFGESDLLYIIKRESGLHNDYKMAWDIVNKEGAKNIIKECIKK
jgi:hypothetical protein